MSNNYEYRIYSKQIKTVPKSYVLKIGRRIESTNKTDIFKDIYTIMVTENDIIVNDSKIDDDLLNYFRKTEPVRVINDVNCMYIDFPDLAKLILYTDGTIRFESNKNKLFPFMIMIKTYGKVTISGLVIDKLTIDAGELWLCNINAINKLYTDNPIINCGELYQLNSIIGDGKFSNYGAINADGFNDGPEIDFPKHYFRMLKV